MELTSILYFFGSITITYILSNYVQGFLWGNKYQDGTYKKPWPASPSGLPFFGQGYEAFRRGYARVFTQWSRELGSGVISVPLVQKRVIVLNTGSAVKQALVDRDQCNSSRSEKTNDTVEMVMSDQAKTVFTATFSLYWARLRRGIHKVIGRDRVSQFDPVFEAQSRNLCESIKEEEATLQVDELRELVDTVALEATLAMVVKQEGPLDQVTKQRIIEICRKTQDIQTSAWYFRYSPFVQFAKVVSVLMYGTNSITRLRNELLDIVLGLQGPKVKPGSIAAALERTEPSKNDPEPVQLTHAEIAVNLVHLTLHGYQMLSSALFTLIQRLASLPELQERMYKQLTAADDKALVHAFVLESLRFNPPCRIYSHTSRVDHDLEIDGTEYRVDDGTPLVVNLDNIHFDSTSYRDPHTFNPDRFLAASADISVLDKPVKGKYAKDHLAFGVGRRACQGSLASQRLMAAVVEALVRRYKLRGGDPDTQIDLHSGVWSWTGRTETKGVAVEFSARRR